LGQLLIGALSVVADHGNNGARWAQAGERGATVSATPGSPFRG
jgi:hypothetical protein